MSGEEIMDEFNPLAEVLKEYVGKRVDLLFGLGDFS